MGLQRSQPTAVSDTTEAFPPATTFPTQQLPALRLCPQQPTGSGGIRHRILQAGNFKPGTFEEPWFPTGLRIDSSDDSDDEERSVDYTAPLSSNKVLKQPTPTPTKTATPGLSEARDEQFKISPKALAFFDEEVMDSILRAARCSMASSTPTAAEDHRRPPNHCKRSTGGGE